MKKLFLIVLLLSGSLSGKAQADTSGYMAMPRLNYYTNDEVGEIIVITPGQLTGNKVTVDLVFEYEFLNRGFVVVPGALTTVPFEMKRLREGENEITVSFYENDKWTDSRKVYLTIMPHKENAVKVDQATGGLFVSGLPYFPAGFFAGFPVNPDIPGQEAVNGFNMISPYQDLNKKTFKQRKAYMDRCADLGMRVSYNVSGSIYGGRDESCGQQENTKPFNKERLKKEILAMRDHPALLSWYIAEEPDSREIPADSLAVFYRLIKELDPYHPVSLMLSTPRKAGTYLGVTDIILINPNPVPQGTIREVYDYTRIAVGKTWPGKPVWIVPQAFGGNRMWSREPNAAEVRAMTYMAIIHGASGVQYTLREPPNSFPKSTATWGECSRIAMELAELTPDLLSPHPAPGVLASEAGIHARAWNRRGMVTIAIVNEKNEPLNFSLEMEDFNVSVMADNLFENRKVAIVEGMLKDMIDGYGTRIYRFDARQRTGQEILPDPQNLTIDPGFEDMTIAGVPSACYAYPGTDPGCTYFTDPRRHYEGDHSLRMNNPSDGPGNLLSFYPVNADSARTYTVSIMARSGPSPNKSGGKKGGPVRFRLAFGAAEQVFECTSAWEKYEIRGIRFDGAGPAQVSPELELIGKGTAWFDLIQVVAE